MRATKKHSSERRKNVLIRAERFSSLGIGLENKGSVRVYVAKEPTFFPLKNADVLLCSSLYEAEDAFRISGVRGGSFDGVNEQASGHQNLSPFDDRPLCVSVQVDDCRPTFFIFEELDRERISDAVDCLHLHFLCSRDRKFWDFGFFAHGAHSGNDLYGGEFKGVRPRVCRWIVSLWLFSVSSEFFEERFEFWRVWRQFS